MVQSLADFAVSIGTDGKIVAQGTIPEVLGADKVMSKRMQQVEESIEMAEEEMEKPAAPQSGGKLIVAEEIEEGHVSWQSGTLYDFQSCLLGSPLQSNCSLWDWEATILLCSS